MKAFKAAIMILMITNSAYAQNIGIGNKNPEHKLDISGRMRIRGGNNLINSAGIWLSGIGADSTTVKTFIGMASDTTVGFFGQNHSWKFVHDFRTGYTGINNQSPNYPLSFINDIGPKISLSDAGNGYFYGFSTGTNTLQFQVPGSANDFQFGLGSGNNFSETMRLTGTGLLGLGNSNPSLAGLTVDKKVGAVHALLGSNTTGLAFESDYPGIGFNSYYNNTRKAIANGYGGYIGVNPAVGGMVFGVSPNSATTGQTMPITTALSIAPNGNIGVGLSDAVFKVDVGGRMRLRAETSNTAGIWLNNSSNTTTPAFMGMQSDTTIGFYGIGTGWSLTMNTQTGAVSFGGNTGAAGQVLRSSGNGGAPIWVDPVRAYYSSNATLQFAVNEAPSNKPFSSGGDVVITCNQASTLMISAHISGHNNGGCPIIGLCYTMPRIIVFIDGVLNPVSNWFLFYDITGNVDPTPIPVSNIPVNVGPGTHTIQLGIIRDETIGMTFHMRYMSILVMPQ
jgi:hypothetical protein